MSDAELLGAKHEHLVGSVQRGTDTLDVWFDSGTSWSTLQNANQGPQVTFLTALRLNDSRLPMCILRGQINTVVGFKAAS